MTERGRQTLDRWLQEIIDRSHRNPLLNATSVSPAGRRGTSLTITAPGATRLLSLLLTGRALSFATPVASQAAQRRSGYRLRRSEGELAWNPALEVKLEEFGAAFPEGDLGELEDAPQRLDELLRQVEAAVAGLVGL